MRKFDSKKDTWIGLIIWIPLLTALIMTGYSALSNSVVLAVFIIILFSNLFAAWIWFDTYYVLEEKYLYVRCGPFSEKIYYETVRGMKATRNPLSSPALSINRIEIRHGKYEATLVSPKERDEFVREMGYRCKEVDVSINI